jgi:hypothetical protein
MKTRAQVSGCVTRTRCVHMALYCASLSSASATDLQYNAIK